MPLELFNSYAHLPPIAIKSIPQHRHLQSTNMMALDAEVIIVGAGIGGLTLAAICNQVGISYKVLERTETLQPVGAGISLSPNALRVLDQLGIYETLLPTAQKMRKLQIWRNQTQWNTLSFEKIEPTYGYPVLSTERHAFHRLLYAAAGAGDKVVLDSKVVQVVDVPGEPVRVVVEGGKEYRALIVVGADGIRSAVRRALLRKNGLKQENTIQFSGRVHFSGYTRPLKNCGPEQIGVGNWMLYDQAILTTWPCRDNRQWYIGVKVSCSLIPSRPVVPKFQGNTDMSTQKAEGEVDKNRSVWGSITPEDIKKVYGRAFHPFAEGGQFGNSKQLPCAAGVSGHSRPAADEVQSSTNQNASSPATCSRKSTFPPCMREGWLSLATVRQGTRKGNAGTRLADSEANRPVQPPTA